jgi:hypothetical protein
MVPILLVAGYGTQRLSHRYGSRLIIAIATLAALIGRGGVSWRERRREYVEGLAEVDSPVERLRTAIGLLVVAGPQIFLAPAIVAFGQARSSDQRRRERRTRPIDAVTPAQGSTIPERAAAWLVVSAIRALDSEEDSVRYSEEWFSDLGGIPSGWRKMRFALTLRVFSPSGIRRSRSTSRRA